MEGVQEAASASLDVLVLDLSDDEPIMDVTKLRHENKRLRMDVVKLTAQNELLQGLVVSNRAAVVTPSAPSAIATSDAPLDRAAMLKKARTLFHTDRTGSDPVSNLAYEGPLDVALEDYPGVRDSWTRSLWGKNCQAELAAAGLVGLKVAGGAKGIAELNANINRVHRYLQNKDGNAITGLKVIDIIKMAHNAFNYLYDNKLARSTWMKLAFEDRQLCLDLLRRLHPLLRLGANAWKARAIASQVYSTCKTQWRRQNRWPLPGMPAGEDKEGDEDEDDGDEDEGERQGRASKRARTSTIMSGASSSAYGERQNTSRAPEERPRPTPQPRPATATDVARQRILTDPFADTGGSSGSPSTPPTISPPLATELSEDSPGSTNTTTTAANENAIDGETHQHPERGSAHQEPTPTHSDGTRQQASAQSASTPGPAPTLAAMPEQPMQQKLAITGGRSFWGAEIWWVDTSEANRTDSQYKKDWRRLPKKQKDYYNAQYLSYKANPTTFQLTRFKDGH
ncbi:hypothetical protein CONPUDRAFT_150533 [Coniophora puteana RWD-64-598 SS2]|uniref:Uncharacterized protein n=1 Tax=Coniophora puteana (strain RWD-64-598) TaxID=741705 RepID=A0A5M3N2Y7_CONPW|nr:uncharacterized protein CONPUDRAFT_150533 [Coniophora puteana RWD-64-598 SS2]EIW85752.1 hypothetical protein CONPUDRAFT_150533 [Coniophora puteana RWD-64-598 SS2]